MATPQFPSLSEKHVVVHIVAGKSIQTIQGLYYIVAGVGVALAVQILQPMTGARFPILDEWPIRLTGLAVAVIGLVFARSGLRREGPFMEGWVPLVVALVLFFLGVVGFTSGVLPDSCLIDTGLEFLFGSWWLVAILHGITTAPTRSMEESSPRISPI